MVYSNSEDEKLSRIEELLTSSTEEDKEFNKMPSAEVPSPLLDPLEEEENALDILSDLLGESTPSIFTPEKEIIPAVNPTKETLSEKQEKTRSQLATFLLRILAGTLISSLVLILSLIYISTNVDEKKVETFDKTSALVKDLIRAC